MSNGFTVSDFATGDRVEIHPCTDLWMMGARFGTVIKLGRKFVHVELDKTGRSHKFLPANILDVFDNIRESTNKENDS